MMDYQATKGIGKMFSRAHALPICQHEVGHYIISGACRFPTGDIEITIKRHIGYVTQYSHAASSTVHLQKVINGMDEVKQYLTDRIAILTAGVLCQSIENNEIDNEKACELWFKDDAQSDRDKAYELAILFDNILHPEVCPRDKVNERISDVLGLSWGKAKELIEENMGLILEMSEAVYKMIPGYNMRLVISHEELEGIREKYYKNLEES